VGFGEAAELRVPVGFRIETFASNIGGARALALDPQGVPLVAVPSKGRVVALPAGQGSGGAADVVTVLEGLDLPHGLAFHRGHLYVAETSRIVRYRYHAPTRGATDPTVIVRGLPRAGHHWTRGIVFGRDGKLYVAIGSSCDVCQESDRRRAAIVRYNADGSGEQLFATGLRNPVGLGLHPRTGMVWTSVNERDWPGGGAPPDYVTEIRQGRAYGWPRCYAEQRAFRRDRTMAGPEGCEGMTLPTIELTPHAAPLGLAFYTGRQFPAEYVGDLFVALHGSRAGLPAAGYTIARIRLRDGQPPTVENFATGWRSGDRVIGRPVDLVVGRDGSLFVSDDHGDRVHRVTYARRR
jgi:glucose/arabinose dehydrogenase